MPPTSHQATIAQWVLLLSIALLPIACNTTNKPYSSEPKNYSKLATDAQTTPAQLDQLNIAIIPHRASETEQEKIALLATYLQETLGFPVNIQLTKDYTTSIDLLVSGKVKMAYLGPFSYVKAKEQNPNLEPIVAHIEKSSGRPWYTSTIIVNTNSGIETVEDLKGKRFGFVNESSTSGYLFPSAYFKTSGIDPNTDFSAINYAGSHDNNVTALVEGTVDAIAIDKSTYLLAKESGTLPETHYQLLWESEPIPNSPIVIDSQLPELLQVELKKALINAPAGVVAVSGLNADGYTLVQDENYEPIRQVQQLLNVDSH